jgi:2-phosphoglycerate kinase
MDDSLKKHKYIVISDEKHGLPFSKGLMASSIMATGLSPAKAYRAARMIEDHLRENGISFVTIEQLSTVAYEILDSHMGEEYAQKYLKWQALAKLDKPLIVLIGGTTGVGKSTIATEIAHRLGITRIVNTDSIREVMRAIFSKELMPTLHMSSFNAGESLRMPLPDSVDPLIVGFREQTAAVVVGIQAIIERGINERISMVLEGVHLVPGFIDSQHFKDAFVIPLVITVKDPEVHRSHFYIRAVETEGFRPFERYKANFENIRKIGKYIESLARESQTPVLTSYSMDATVSKVLEEIINRVIVPAEFEKTKSKE